MSSIVREGNSGGGILGLLATCVFTFGALLVILFLFLPIIDQAYVSRQAAVIDAGERRKRRIDEELRTKQRERLRDEKPDPDLFGLLTLAVGAIGFLAPSQSTPRKVVGAIVITVQMVVIFMLYMMPGSIRGF